MQIQVLSNPNCEGSEQFVFNELSTPKPLRGIRITERGKDIECDVVGVEESGRFTEAFAAKIADSGAGFAYLIYGGGWGLRIRPAQFRAEAWSLENKRQWGESFKIYGSEEDIIYADQK